jgi:hypothetical protein
MRAPGRLRVRALQNSLAPPWVEAAQGKSIGLDLPAVEICGDGYRTGRGVCTLLVAIKPPKTATYVSLSVLHVYPII